MPGRCIGCDNPFRVGERVIIIREAIVQSGYKPNRYSYRDHTRLIPHFLATRLGRGKNEAYHEGCYVSV